MALPRRLDAEVVIVGAGIAGSSLHHALARRGVDALLLERGEGPGGASGIPAALLNPHRGRTARARQLDLDGLSEFWRLSDRLRAAGHDPGSHRGGVLRVASSARQAAAWRRLAGAQSAEDDETGLLWLEPRAVPAPYHAPFGGLLVPEGGWVEAPRLLDALSASALAAGARAEAGTELTGWRIAPGDGVAVECADLAEGSRRVLRARELVLCLGAYDAAACRLPRLELAPGVAVTFTIQRRSQPSAPPPLAGAVGIVPLGAAVIVSGGTLPLSGGRVEPGAIDQATERLRRTAAWFLPGLESAAVSGAWHGTRARRPSGNPVVRRLASGVTLFGGLAGRGFLCGPLLAERLATALAERLVGAQRL